MNVNALRTFALATTLLLASGVTTSRADGMPPITANELPTSMTPGHDILPGTTIRSTAATVIDGLYEVVAGENVLYVDTTGRYLVIGSIYDLKDDVDLSAVRRAEISRVATPPDARASTSALEQLPGEASVTTGAGSRLLTVITDPQCGWCRRLWAESLRDLDGVRVQHVLVQPTAQAVGILCAADPGAAMAAALTVAPTSSKTPVPTPACRHQASQHIERARQFVDDTGLHGTPILIRDDGDVHAGYLGRTALLKWLQGDTDAS